MRARLAAALACVAVLATGQAARADSSIVDMWQAYRSGMTALKAGDKAKADALFDRVLRTSATGADGLYLHAAVFVMRDQLDSAITTLDNATRLDGRNADYLSLRARAWARKADQTKDRAAYTEAVNHALADYGSAIQLQPRAPELLQRRAQMYLVRKDYRLAIADLDAAIAITPSAEALDRRATAYSKLGDKRQALADMDEAVRLAPDNAHVYQHRSDYLSAMGEGDRALADLDLAVRLTPDDPDTLNSRCFERALRNRDLDGALVDCDRSIKLEPNAERYDSRGFVRFRKGDLHAALDDYARALELDPKLSESLFMRGVIRLRQGDVAGGRQDIGAASALKPDVVAIFATYGVTP